MGWVGSGHTKWTHGQLWTAVDNVYRGRRRATALLRSPINSLKLCRCRYSSYRRDDMVVCWRMSGRAEWQDAAALRHREAERRAGPSSAGAGRHHEAVHHDGQVLVDGGGDAGGADGDRQRGSPPGRDRPTHGAVRSAPARPAAAEQGRRPVGTQRRGKAAAGDDQRQRGITM